MRILIAEADAPAIPYADRILRSLGHHVVKVHDGAAAWNLIERSAPHVVISDWALPLVNGLELCRRMRRRVSDRYTYCILMVGREVSADRIEGLDAGADDFLNKPLDARELAARIGVAERILSLQAELRDKARMLEELSSQLARMNERLTQEATTDPLTGLFNRRHLEEVIYQLTRQSDRHDRNLALALADIDHFKDYNDQFGHPAGDDALCRVATSLQAGVRSHDYVARFGGEEFAIVLPDAEAESATQIVERLRELVEGASWPLRGVTLSAGITNRRPLQSVDQMFREADAALYSAKRAGRNRVVHHATLRPHGSAEFARCGTTLTEL